MTKHIREATKEKKQRPYSQLNPGCFIGILDPYNALGI